MAWDGDELRWHRCLALGCPVRVVGRKGFCAAHWEKVTPGLQEKVKAAGGGGVLAGDETQAERARALMTAIAWIAWVEEGERSGESEPG